MNNTPQDIRKVISQDQRRYERLNLDVTALYCLADVNNIRAGEWAGPFAVDNISGKGINLSISEKLSIGTRMQMKIIISHEPKPILLTGTIIWRQDNVPSGDKRGKTSQPYSVGIRIDEMNKEDEKRFITYISDNILSKYLDDGDK